MEIGQGELKELSEPMSREELIRLRENCQDELNSIADKRAPYSERTEVNHAKIKKKEQVIIKNLRSELLGQKDRFKNVFKTERGSFYFVTETGQSLRFKGFEEADIESIDNDRVDLEEV